MIKKLLSKLMGIDTDLDAVKKRGAAIIDVRSRAEFSGGHAKGAINMPVETIQSRLEEIKNMKKPLIFCCASGARSGQAVSFLKQNGVTEIYNAGPWQNV